MVIAVPSAVAIWFSPTAASATASVTWTVVPTQDVSSQANYLQAVAIVAPDDVWAVGADYRRTATPGPLTEHWDGASWTAVKAPSVNQLYNELFDVSAASSADVWAVGYAQHGSGNYGAEKTLVEHWSGSAWAVVPSPNLGTKANFLNAVDAVSATDAWAVGLGNSATANSGRALITRWDGSAWHRLRAPDTGPGFAELLDVLAISPTDVWAVGDHAGSTLVEHWDGAAWTVVPSPNGPNGPSALLSVSGTSGSDLWAVGRSGNRTLAERWNGSAWTVVPTPNGSLPTSHLGSVVALGPTDAWAVGYTEDDVLVKLRTLAAHWDGASWTLVPTPDPGPEYDTLGGIDALPGGDVWAVGSQDEFTLALRTTDG